MGPNQRWSIKEQFQCSVVKVIDDREPLIGKEKPVLLFFSFFILGYSAWSYSVMIIEADQFHCLMVNNIYDHVLSIGKRRSVHPLASFIFLF
jgi:hypothetical protein